MTTVGKPESSSTTAPSADGTVARAGGPGKTAELDSLTGVRSVSAVIVFITHATFVAGLFASATITKAVGVLLPLGMIQVSVFFVLSGFVLTWSARPSDAASGFWWRRFVKIYPNHLVTFVILLSFVLVTGVSVTGAAQTGVQASGIGIGPALTNLFLVHSWVANPDYSAGLNIVSWSLSVEVFFYLLFPLLVKGVRRLPGSWLWPAAIGAAVLVWLIPLFSLRLGGPPVPGIGVSAYAFWVPYYLPLSRLPEFVLGMLLARIVQDGRAFRFSATLAAVLAIVCLGTGLAVLPFPFLPAATTVIPIGLLIMSLATADLNGRRSWLRRKAPVYLGRRSFAFYLVHWPVILIANWLLGERHWSTPVALAIIALFFVLSAAAAWLLYRFVESVAMRRLSRLVRRTSAVEPTTVAVA